MKSCYQRQAVKMIAPREDQIVVSYGWILRRMNLLGHKDFVYDPSELYRDSYMHCVVSGDPVEHYHTFHPPGT